VGGGERVSEAVLEGEAPWLWVAVGEADSVELALRVALEEEVENGIVVKVEVGEKKGDESLF
jgi:hypothetical protein